MNERVLIAGAASIGLAMAAAAIAHTPSLSSPIQGYGQRPPAKREKSASLERMLRKARQR